MRQNLRKSLSGLGTYLIGFASLILIWHVCSAWLLSSVLFPTPWKVLLKAIELAEDGTLWEQASASLARIATGFAGGSLLGIPLGLAIGSFPLVRRLLEPIYTTVFIVIINTAAGVSAVAPNKIRAARSLGAGPLQVFFFVALPATVPYILTGMRLAMANSFVTIIAAELVAANNGLGRMIWDSRMYMLVDQIFVALVLLGLLGFTADRLFRWGIYAFAGRFSPVT